MKHCKLVDLPRGLFDSAVTSYMMPHPFSLPDANWYVQWYCFCTTDFMRFNQLATTVAHCDVFRCFSNFPNAPALLIVQVEKFN